MKTTYNDVVLYIRLERKVNLSPKEALPTNEESTDSTTKIMHIAAAIADRHMGRNIRYMPQGRCLVLSTPASYVFRNESFISHFDERLIPGNIRGDMALKHSLPLWVLLTDSHFLRTHDVPQVPSQCTLRNFTFSLLITTHSSLGTLITQRFTLLFIIGETSLPPLSLIFKT
jgi:hypothetical protein